MPFLIGVVSVVFAFGLVIFVHEFGHFIVAKKSGVKVERFSFGLGPELFGIQWGETRYCLACIPLGGEVRMAGESDVENGPSAAPRDPREFFALSWYRRIPIVVAGPAMNYVLAFVLFTLISLVWGYPHPSSEPVVGDLAEGFPAAKAGLAPGDRFLSVNGVAVSDWKSMAEKVHASAGKALSLEVRRKDRTLSFKITPAEDKGSGRGLMGVTPVTVHERLGPAASAWRGAQQCWGWSKVTLVYLGEKIAHRQKLELSGPVGIASVLAKAAKSGMGDYLFLVALISVGIGLFNLFPIPMLDGGHLLFFLCEGIFRRPVGKRVVQAANMAGLAALLSIFLFATYGDIQRLRTPAAPESSASTPRP